MWLVVELIVFVSSFMFMRKVKSQVVDGQVINDSLTKKEKIIVWIASLLQPIIAGAVFYYGWKKKLPAKAKQANNISLIVFLLWLVAFGIILYLFGTESLE